MHMKMTITVDSLTTDKMLRFASALEQAGLLHEDDAEIELSGDASEIQPLVEAVEATEAREATEVTELVEAVVMSSQSETPPLTPPNYEEAHQLVLPLIGSIHSTRLLPLAAVTRLLNISVERLWSLCDSGAIEAVKVTSERGYTFRYFTPEQVQVLELAVMRLRAQGRVKLSRPFLREVASDWLETHPQYASAYWARVPRKGALYPAISYDRRRWHASRRAA